MRQGRWAERLCVLYLRLKGFAILAERHVTGRGTGAGEIDIVARRNDLLIFVEVKRRPSLDAAAAAISAAQRQRLWRAGDAFLARHPELAGIRIRFDAMLVAPWRWPRHLADAWRNDD